MAPPRRSRRLNASKKRSPDSVVSLDVIDSGSRRRLKSVRKRLKAESSSSGQQPARAAVVTSIIDLTDLPDDPASTAAVAASPSVADTISLVRHPTETTSSSVAIVKTEEGRKPAATTTNSVPVIPSTSVQRYTDVIEVANPNTVAVAATPAAGSLDADIAIVGVANEVLLPHARHDCKKYAFVPDLSMTLDRPPYIPLTLQRRKDLHKSFAENVKFCEQCYCYVCDKPAKYCKHLWNEGYWAHCLASNKGTMANIWKQQRTAKQQVSRRARVRTETEPTPQELERQQKMQIQELDIPGDSPWKPDTPLAAFATSLTECRYCGWYSRLLRPSVEVDLQSVYCHCCGRVAVLPEVAPAGRACTQGPNDILLGTKVIPFTLYTRYPPDMQAHAKYWKKYEDSTDGWTYKVADMEQDVFDVRFASANSISMVSAICESIPVSSNQPEDGADGKMKYDETNYNATLPQPQASTFELDFVELKDRNHVTIFNSLRQFKNMKKSSCFSLGGKIPIGFNIRAEWNKPNDSHDNGRGRFFVEVFFRHEHLGLCADIRSECPLASLLGAWYGIFPFPLASLSSGIAAEAIDDSKIDWFNQGSRQRVELAVAPFYLTKEGVDTKDAEVDDLKSSCLAKYNKEAAEIRGSKLTLVCSGKNRSLTTGGLGGYAGPPSENNLRGILKNYIRETLMENIFRTPGSSQSISYSWIGRAYKITSFHRCMRSATDSDSTVIPRSSEIGYTRSNSMQTALPKWITPAHILEACLSLEDISIATQHFQEAAQSFVGHMGSLNAFVQHMENLGHNSILHVRGLKVELLDFQKQAVCWMLEREQTPGGLESFLWAKLPIIEAEGKTLYYSPIFDCVTDKKPPLVRGGLLCSQMGLGKTIMSLALILKNPAPLAPASGTQASLLHRMLRRDHLGWNDEPEEKEASSKRGSILSRGTLVICPVSLVGQWIREAKSKLNDPQLVYPYHGQNRMRDAAVLSRSSIVVTTYAVIASDVNYHAQKSGKEDYCAPLEQIRWWRVICDESHVMRTGATQQTQAVENIVAENKWCVTGTPVNTSMTDLKTQLQFVGLSNVAKYFQLFNSTTFSRMSTCTDGAISLPHNRHFGHFAFFARQCILRHSMKQQYRKSSTDLMQLPPKTERKLEISFNSEELVHYKGMESRAKSFYETFKKCNADNISSNYLALTSKLEPLRVACAGGFAPLDDKAVNDEGDKNDEDDIAARPKVNGRYANFAFTSKFNILIQELKRIRDREPDSKSLVFSKYSSSLNWLQKELPKHGFTWATLTGSMTMSQRSKALQDFQTSPPTKIFLLSMRAGAVGINLTQANRVFLLEPSMNPALEAQAIGRVHRLGQRRNVEIIRLVIKKSVESRTLHLLKSKYGEKAADVATTAAAGSLTSDKNTVLAGDFDLLFGVRTRNIAALTTTLLREALSDDANGSNSSEPDNAFSGCV